MEMKVTAFNGSEAGSMTVSDEIFGLGRAERFEVAQREPFQRLRSRDGRAALDPVVEQYEARLASAVWPKADDAL